MNKKVLLFTYLFLLIFPVLAVAETNIKAGVDKTKLTTDDVITYKLTITSSDRDVPAPQLPDFEGFALVSQSQSSSISLSKGNMKSTVEYIYLLLPVETGQLKIGPSRITAGGNTYSSESFEVEVKQGKLIPQQPEMPERRKPALPGGIQPDSDLPQYTI